MVKCSEIAHFSDYEWFGKRKEERGEQKDIRLVFLEFSSPCFHCLLRVASRNVRYVEDRLHDSRFIFQFPGRSSQKLHSTNLKHGHNKGNMVDPLAGLKLTLMFLLPKRLLIPIWCESWLNELWGCHDKLRWFQSWGCSRGFGNWWNVKCGNLENSLQLVKKLHMITVSPNY